MFDPLLLIQKASSFSCMILCFPWLYVSVASQSLIYFVTVKIDLYLDGELLDPDLGLYPIGTIKFKNGMHVLCAHFGERASKASIVAVLQSVDGSHLRKTFDVDAGNMIYKLSADGENTYEDAAKVRLVFFSTALKKWFHGIFEDKSPLQNVTSVKTHAECNCNTHSKRMFKQHLYNLVARVF